MLLAVASEYESADSASIKASILAMSSLNESVLDEPFSLNEGFPINQSFTFRQKTSAID